MQNNPALKIGNQIWPEMLSHELKNLLFDMSRSGYSPAKGLFYIFVVLQFTVGTYIVLLTVGVYSSNHAVLYTIVVCMTGRFKKKCRPVRSSVCPLISL